ncbi:up-regulator of cell proliferation-like [Tachysurus vachellii]|uniref:up-regulator of cell proliferation-like n=1 Tax=Tachysurus vachellii TaxID=175792 RepID=UPI00296B0293|nr:up-regulator of cell proliferation-like [Tachysurus vachellii]XP_060735610.1 up-regulator of cell proliferation-like [Tachysurus vachellii]XP_060735611.1 up-regulator of cell proliferation-like [Tachysurus vachellii]
MASKQQKDFLAFLKTLGLKKYFPNKLTLKSLLEINSASLSDKDVQSLHEIPEDFLRKLLMVNSDSRTVICAPDENKETNDLFAEQSCDSTPNLLDVHAALFACADSFLQQEMALKMSMCQFAVPFVLPQGGHNQCTLMLWALRGILKEWRPHSMTESKGFVEDSVVHAKIPMISFVRLSNCSLTKSKVLNQVLKNSQQHQDFFCYQEMIGGSAPRVISNGMVEICWSLPCGNKTIDVFPEPVVFANLRGDVCTFETQFSFLSQVSTAVFVFLDSVDENEQILFASLQEMKSKCFLVVNTPGNMSEKIKSSIKAAVDTLQLERDHVIQKSKTTNFATFSKMISSSITKVLGEHHRACEIEAMKTVAQNLGLRIDENDSTACVSANKTAEEIMKCIGVRPIVEYKKSQLPLQGENWKRLAQIEKEQCRLQHSGLLSLEEYKAQLQNEKEEILEKQSNHKITKTMDILMKALSTSDDIERAFFLRWLGLKLDMRSRKHMTALRHKYRECEQKKDRDAVAQLDQELIDSSLGIEHYLRELGQIYEAASFVSHKITDKIGNLPTLAAKLLLAGFPLEILDGDASNIPEKWVSDVLMELHKMVKERSRLLIITVLGVQSSGKSTLLNTMFGVQFSVGSGRCTRGAYMILLPVGEDLKEELLCDFVLLIDTEGLKSPALAQLEDSYDHDNELATFVIGLSDITIINVAMENSTEMKDVLQIAVHAFLRMKEIGKKTVCHFVHQNVAGVSAHEKNMTDRQKLLDQLNEMTLIAAEMEKKPHVRKFTDVLDYDVEKNNWYIPGLWHGTPPMAPVNTGYSVAVLDFKKNLLEMLKARKGEQLFQIPEFLQWMSSLWKAVKFENFIFSFRNTLVAHAYDNLCKEFSDWEWSFRRPILFLISKAEVQLSNTETSSIHGVVDALKKKTEKELMIQLQEMTKKLKEYYKRKDRNVHLVEKYKTDFIKSINCLETEMKNEVNKRLDLAIEMKKNTAKLEEIHSKQAAMVESQVLQLLQKYKARNDEVSDEDLKADFERMWRREIANFTGLKERDVPADVLKQLRASLGNRQVNEDFQNVTNLTQCGKEGFKVRSKHINTGKGFQAVKDLFTKKSTKQALQIVAVDAINSCSRMIEQCSHFKSDYQDTFTKDVLDEIDANLKIGNKYNITFEIELKLHICGIASRTFLEMHRKYLSEQDPVKHLQKLKNQYLSNFIDLYRERDQCQKKAQNFTQLCLKPAVTEYIDQSIGPDIVDAVLENESTAYSSRSLFQYTIQKELLEKSNFSEIKGYSLHYKNYVKDWIYNHIVRCFSKDLSLQKLKMKKLEIIIKMITEAVETCKLEASGSPLPNDADGTTKLIQKLCKTMMDVISIPMSTVDSVLFQNTSCCDPFTKCLCECIDELKQQISKEISESTDIKETLKKVSIKPQDELFKRVFGCGVQCPFCKTPCEAGGKEHQQHHAAVHRPQGIGRYRYSTSNSLCEEICTSSVHGNGTFLNQDTNFQPHPCKDYRKYYPDWHIAPDMSIEASDYWKYVLVTFNKEFAGSYKALPAVYPDVWNQITKDQAFISLKLIFNIK